MRLSAANPILFLCGLLAFVSLAVTAHAQPRPRRPADTAFAEGRLMKQMAEELGLSEAVLAKIDAAATDAKAEEEKLRTQTLAAIDELNDLLTQSLPSEKALLAATGKLGDLAAESRMAKMRYNLKVRSLLTPEQLKTFMESRNKAARPKADRR